MNIIALILNFPYTFIGIIAGVISIPTSLNFHKNPYAMIVKVKSFWWGMGGHYSRARAMAIGNSILLSPREEEHDLEHELIHVKQHNHAPLIYPILYYYQSWKYGYRKNKYEDEAYTKSGSVYRGK